MHRCGLTMWRAVQCTILVCMSNSRIVWFRSISSNADTIYIVSSFTGGGLGTPCLTHFDTHHWRLWHNMPPFDRTPHASQRSWKNWYAVRPLEHLIFNHVRYSCFENIFAAVWYNELFCRIDWKLKYGCVRNRHSTDMWRLRGQCIRSEMRQVSYWRWSCVWRTCGVIYSPGFSYVWYLQQCYHY